MNTQEQQLALIIFCQEGFPKVVYTSNHFKPQLEANELKGLDIRDFWQRG